uniref:Putative secreted peptide n=1 Tax=Anopheles braziliensis TaxID=58242 RepID=A0A2M3ZNK5_9DIPT
MFYTFHFVFSKYMFRIPFFSAVFFTVYCSNKSQGHFRGCRKYNAATRGRPLRRSLSMIFFKHGEHGFSFCVPPLNAPTLVEGWTKIVSHCLLDFPFFFSLSVIYECVGVLWVCMRVYVCVWRCFCVLSVLHQNQTQRYMHLSRAALPLILARANVIEVSKLKMFVLHFEILSYSSSSQTFYYLQCMDKIERS